MISYIVTNMKTNRSYTVRAHDNSTLRSVWMSEKIWFRGGSKVRIMNEKGRSMTFIKKEIHSEAILRQRFTCLYFKEKFQ